MLHYFPTELKENQNIDGLCGWHLDHGAVTILVSPLYFDLKGNKVNKPENCGLYVKNRKGETIKVDIPEDCLAL